MARSRSYLKILLCVLGVSLALLVFSWLRVPTADDAVCGGATLEAKFALGTDGERSLRDSANAFSDAGPGCLRRLEVQKVKGDNSKFFCQGPDELDAENGVDSAPVFFFFGHGMPDSWTAGTNDARQTCMRVGEPPRGMLRYYFQCSCQVFAHGPLHTERHYDEYPAPWDFTKGPNRDLYKRRSVYRRWGPVLGPSTRLACGLSSVMPCGDSQVRKTMLDKEGFLDVADAFLEGIEAAPGDQPICLTKVTRDHPLNPDPTHSALYDRALTMAPRERAEGKYGFYFIEYLRSTDKEHRRPLLPAHTSLFALETFSEETDYTLIHASLIDTLRNALRGFVERAASWRLRRPRVYNDASVRLTPILGDCPPEASKCGRDDYYSAKALSFVKTMGWLEPDLDPAPEVLRVVIDAYPLNNYVDELPVTRFQKGVIVRFRRMLPGVDADQGWSDPSGAIVIEMNRKGRVAKAWKRWRSVTKTIATFNITDLDAYRLDATAQLHEKADGYLVAGPPELVYEERGEELVPHLRFVAVPKRAELFAKYPPLRLDVAAR
jgi:hypothetical protein